MNATEQYFTKQWLTQRRVFSNLSLSVVDSIKLTLPLLTSFTNLCQPYIYDFKNVPISKFYPG